MKGYPEMNTEDMDYYEYEESKKRFTPKKIVKFIFSLIAAAIIITVFALIFIRISLIKIPKAFTGITWTDAALELYDSDKSFDYIGYPLGETYGPQSNVQNAYDPDSGETYTVTEGLYHVSNIYMSKSTGEVQFTVRYNKRSTVNALMEAYKLEKRPEGELFVYVLTDHKGNRYTDYVFAADSNPMQEYRRVIFKNVDLDELINDKNPADTFKEGDLLESGNQLTLTVYYGDDVRENGRMNASFVLYDSNMPYEVPEIKKTERTALIFSDKPYYESKLPEIIPEAETSADTANGSLPESDTAVLAEGDGAPIPTPGDN